MNPRLTLIIFLICVICGQIPSAHGAEPETKEPKNRRTPSAARPNIILVLVDNLGYGDIGCFGSTVHRTPNIDRLASEGVRLTSFYSSSPVCSPSRASVLTGSYPRRVGLHVDFNGTQVLMASSPRGLNPDEHTLPELLKEQGYATACFGKWHLGDQPPFLPLNHGFDEFFGLPYSEDMGEREARDFRVAMPPLPLLEGNKVIEAPPDPSLLTKRFTNRAINFITRHSSSEKRAEPATDQPKNRSTDQQADREKKASPFFLYLPHTMPGSTPTSFASEAFAGRSANGTYGDSVEELDWSMGEILAALKKHNIDENTLILWTSDNGPTERPGQPHGSIDPLTGYGYSTFEGGMRMPFVARWPGQIPAETVSDEVTTAMDLLPTLLHLAGGEVPTDRPIDGHDIWPILAGVPGARSPHEAFYYYFLGQLQAVRSGKWKLYLPLEEKWDRRRWRGEKGDPSSLKLVDLDKDIREEHDLAPTNPDIVTRLTGYAEKARTELGDIGRPGTAQRPAGHYPDPRPLWLIDVKSVPE